MKIDQTDIAHLTDDNVRRMVLALTDSTVHEAGPLPDFYRRLAVALVRAFRTRRGAFAALECDFLNDDGEGAIVGPDDDPVADALEELRRGISRLERDE